MGGRLFLRVAMLCGIFSAAAAPILAQQLVGSDVNPARYRIKTDREQAESSRFRYAMLDTDVLKGSRISLRLFNNLNVDAVGQKGRRQHRSETWTGIVDGHPLSSVVIALDETGVLFGKVEFEGKTFIVRPKTGNVHAILEVRNLPMEDEGADDGVPLPGSDLDAAVEKFSAASVCLPASTCASTTVDVMVVYTPASRNALGGTHAAAQTAIAAAVAEMNIAATNSGISHNFNLVYTDEVQYTESANFSIDLSRLSGSTDGYMDVVHAWRDTYGADLVSLVSATGGCGIGYIQSSALTMSPSAAFSVASPGCLTTNKTLVHEAGHNMGLHHDWFVNASSTPCAWHHGYVNQAAFGGTASQRWRTIMAYNDQCGQTGFNCTRITYFSNPLNQYTANPMGISQGQTNPADAAFALNRTMCQVAEFRTTIPYTDVVASNETHFYGESAGDYPKTYANDGTAQSLTEEETAGWEQSRTSRLEVTWEFDVPGGVAATFYANAWTPASTDGDQMLLSYSSDGSAFTPMFYLTQTSDTPQYQTFDLGTVIGSTLWIRVEDTDRGRGNSVTDRVFVDHMYVRVEASGDEVAPETLIPEIHLADLEIATSDNKKWRTTVRATVHDRDHGPGSGTTVSGKWSDGKDGSCVTDESGACRIDRTWGRRRTASASFSVTSLSKSEVRYDPELNETASVVTVESPASLGKDEYHGEIPVEVTLMQNYPNPFNPSTALEYGLPNTGHVRVSVFNTLGMEVARLHDGADDAGWHSVTFDASELSSGVYIAVVHSANTTRSRVMLLTR